MSPAYRITRAGRFWAVHHEHFGLLADDRECEATAEALADEHAAALDAEAAEIAEAIAAHDEPLLQRAA
jgi:hypothetical protein